MRDFLLRWVPAENWQISTFLYMQCFFFIFLLCMQRFEFVRVFRFRSVT